GTGIVIIPSLGLRSSSYRDGSYKETGAGLMNLEVRGKSSQKFTGIAGVKLMAPQTLDNGMVITPNLNMAMENYFGSSKAKVKAKLTWMDDYFDSKSGDTANKIGFNVGAGLMAKHNNFEFSAGYNYHMEKKYQNHQGS